MNIKNFIKNMTISGKIASKTLEMINKFVVPGVSTNKLNNICNEFIIKNKAKSAILNYMGFPKSICTSVNEVVCHGIPDDNTILKSGDIINIDIAVVKNGFYSDTSKMFIVGSPTKIGKKICEIAKKSLYLAINLIKPGLNLNIIGKSIQKFVENNGFSVVREYCGHGIGKKLHDLPNILHYDSNNKNNTNLKPGMSITIEPMINFGTNKVEVMSDGWTVKTSDNKLSAQYEHTIIVTNHSFKISTIRSYEKF